MSTAEARAMPAPSRDDIARALRTTAEDMSSSAAETVLNENFHKHLYEITSIVRAAGFERTVCDLGGGPGVNLRALRALGHTGRLMLIDRFQEYDEANRMGSRDDAVGAMQEHRIEVIAQDFWAQPGLPVEDGVAAVTTCFDVVEHLPGHPLRQLRELHRLLEPGGRCIISGPNGVSLMKRLKAAAGKYPYASLDAWLQDDFYEHFREYVRSEYEEILRRSGFHDVESRASADVTYSRAAHGYWRRRRSAASPVRLLLWGMAAVETVAPGLRHAVYAWGAKPR
jgi:SAM-dependent methyltransferase